MIIGMIKAHRIIELDAKGGKRRELTLCAEPPPQHRTGLETCWQRSRTPGDTELLAFEAATENYLQREVMRGSGKAAESRSFIPGRDAGQLGRPRALSGRGCSTLTPGSGRMVPRTRVGRSALRAAAPAGQGRSRTAWQPSTTGEALLAHAEVPAV
jgi:hypothetical protein